MQTFSGKQFCLRFDSASVLLSLQELKLVDTVWFWFCSSTMNEAFKMALIAAHLNEGVILVVTSVALGIVSFFPHLMGSPCLPVPLRRQLGDLRFYSFKFYLWLPAGQKLFWKELGVLRPVRGSYKCFIPKLTNFKDHFAQNLETKPDSSI